MKLGFAIFDDKNNFQVTLSWFIFSVLMNLEAKSFHLPESLLSAIRLLFLLSRS